MEAWSNLSPTGQLLYGTLMLLIIALLLTLALYPRVSRWLHKRRVREDKERLLEQLWQQHESVRAHVDWARERKELNSAHALMKQLRSVGADIRALQAELDADERGERGPGGQRGGGAEGHKQPQQQQSVQGGHRAMGEGQLQHRRGAHHNQDAGGGLEEDDAASESDMLLHPAQRRL